MRGQTLDDVVDGNVRGAAYQDAKVALDELADEFDEGVGLACLRPISSHSKPYL